MKVLVTGAGGLLAHAVTERLIHNGDACLRLFFSEEEAIAFKQSHPNEHLLKLGQSIQPGSGSAEPLRVWSKSFQPDVILNLAAWTDVEGCEADRTRAFQSNAIACRDVATVAREFGVPLVSLSTDYVFDGKKSIPYTEEDEPGPLSIYGLTKLMGEEYIRSTWNEHAIVRTSWLFGPSGKNFVDTISKRLLANQRVDVVDDQRGCPTYTRDLAQGIVALIRLNLRGTYHLAATGSCSWFELAREIGRLINKQDLVFRTTTNSLNLRAPRPRFSALDCGKFAKATNQRMPPWQDALRRYIEE